MRVIITLAILAVCLSVGCSRRQRVVYVEPAPLPSPTKANWVRPRQQTVIQPPKPGLPPSPERPAPNQTSAGKAPSQPVTKVPEPIKLKSSLLPPTPPQNPNTSPLVSPEAKLRAAQEKAKISGVHTLTQEDIDGLSYEQIKQLRGY